LTWPIFYANPSALQMIFGEQITAGQVSHLQGRTFANGFLLFFVTT
jgi:hypothetical protein